MPEDTFEEISGPLPDSLELAPSKSPPEQKLELSKRTCYKTSTQGFGEDFDARLDAYRKHIKSINFIGGL